MSHKQRRMFRPSSPEVGGIDVSYIGEVERISSSLIKLLWQSRQKHETSPKGESNTAICYQTERQCFPSGKNIPESTSSVRNEHACYMHGGICDFSNKTASKSTDQDFILTNEEADMSGLSENRHYDSDARESRLLQEKDVLIENDCHEYDKRRSVIDNRRLGIKGMLSEDMARLESQRKGSLKTESVDIVRELRNNQMHIRQLEYKMRERDIQIKLLALRVERLEFVNAGNNAKSQGIDVVQNEVSLKDQHVNSGSIMFPVSKGKTPRSTTTLKLATDELNENLSSTSSDESPAMSSPGCYDKGTNNMECNN